MFNATKCSNLTSTLEFMQYNRGWWACSGHALFPTCILRLVADLARTQEAAKRSLALHTVGDKVGVDGRAVMAAGRVLELEKEV